TPNAQRPMPNAFSASPGSVSVSPCLRGEDRSPPLISLCMIVRDEEPRIEECLRSAAPYVGEMVVVDTGSKDRTREIAAACGARVYEMEWTDSFAAARNASLDLARGQWIYWQDADDVLSPDCGAGLVELARGRPALDA